MSDTSSIAPCFKTTFLSTTLPLPRGERGGYVKKDVDGEEAEVSPSEEGNAIGPWSGIIAL